MNLYGLPPVASLQTKRSLAAVFLSLLLDVLLNNALVDAYRGDKVANGPDGGIVPVASGKKGELLFEHPGGIGLDDFNSFCD